MGSMSSLSSIVWMLCLCVVIAVCLQPLLVASVAVPKSNCYAIDNSSHIVDFSSWIGHTFEYDGKDSDLVVRFCKDVESRSQMGYVDFGRFDNNNHFAAGAGHFDFIQEFYNGDLAKCEQSYDKMGRTAQVNIVCGSCLTGQCKGELGCICDVTYESSCRVLVELAIPCEKRGPRVFKGFTVGFHPRSWEIVYDGLTQLGYEKVNRNFGFRTEQTGVTLYMTAIASLSSLVKKPILKIVPEDGLEVKLSGTGAGSSPPTTLSPTMLNVDWRCEKAHDSPYEVNITIPIDGYEPINFFLTKICENTQTMGGNALKGWAMFGVISCIFFVLSTLICCGGFVYKTRVERQHGIDALPGMTMLSACLETLSGGQNSYARAEDINSAFTNQAWHRPPAPNQDSRRTAERNYGSI